ncbi:unnamed protein product, partial [Ectocarpus sp. 12 AP-2014]
TLLCPSTDTRTHILENPPESFGEGGGSAATAVCCLPAELAEKHHYGGGGDSNSDDNGLDRIAAKSAAPTTATAAVGVRGPPTFPHEAPSPAAPLLLVLLRRSKRTPLRLCRSGHPCSSGGPMGRGVRAARPRLATWQRETGRGTAECTLGRNPRRRR